MMARGMYMYCLTAARFIAGVLAVPGLRVCMMLLLADDSPNALVVLQP